MAKLEFVLGRAGTGKTEYCLRAMRDAMEREPLGNLLLLVVPEHMTYQAERDLVSRMHGRGMMRGFVSGFRRLAWRAAGKSRLPRMTEIGKRLILKKIVGKRAEGLSVLARGAGQRGFTASLSEMIEELKSYRGTPESLKEAASIVDDSYLSKKLEDLALLYGDFLQETETHFEDAEDRMTNLADAVLKGGEFAGAEVWLDGFVFFNPQEKEVLRSFLQTAAAVHITLPMGKDVSVHEKVSPSELFYRAAHTFQDLKRMAEGMGLSYTVKALDGQRRFGADAQGIAAVERGLFDFPVRSEKEKIARGASMSRRRRHGGWKWRQ